MVWISEEILIGSHSPPSGRRLRSLTRIHATSVSLGACTYRWPQRAGAAGRWPRGASSVKDPFACSGVVEERWSRQMDEGKLGKGARARARESVADDKFIWYEIERAAKYWTGRLGQREERLVYFSISFLGTIISLLWEMIESMLRT